MHRLREISNRYLPCPNELDISSSNQFAPQWLELYHSSKTTEHDDQLLREVGQDLEELGERLEDIAEVDERTKGQLDVFRDMFRTADFGTYTAIEDPVIRISREMSAIACSRCDGIVVDLRNGQSYCGREVPQEVLDSNGQLQSID